MLGTVAASAVPLPAPANPAGAAAVIGACSANPAACAIVLGAAGTWILWNNGTKFYCTTYQCQRTNQTPREFRISDDETNTRGVREVHMAMSPAHCDAMLKRFQAQGLRLTLRKKPNPMPGARKMTLCIFEGPDADPDRFADNRHQDR
jgi:hypothetical protein